MITKVKMTSAKQNQGMMPIKKTQQTIVAGQLDQLIRHVQDLWASFDMFGHKLLLDIKVPTERTAVTPCWIFSFPLYNAQKENSK